MGPDPYTIDAVTSPRNKYWFLLTVAARRAITFLEQQKEVNPEKIGFTGFSMGGNITSYSATDNRLKAVIHIVGGTGHQHYQVPGYPESNRSHLDQELSAKTMESQAYWPHVTAPTLFISGTNNFHGRLNLIQPCLDSLPHKMMNNSQTMHNNHSPRPLQMLALEYWFDHYLKGKPAAIPKAPASTLSKISEKSWKFTVTPDDIDRVQQVNVYYSWDTAVSNRFNKPIAAKRNGNTWEVVIPSKPNLPLSVFADIHYPTVSGKPETTLSGQANHFSITSRFYLELPDSLSTNTYKSEVLKGKFEPMFAEFPKDNLIWGTSSRDKSISTYKFNDYALDFPKNKKLKFYVNTEHEDLSLLVSLASTKSLLKERNQLSGTLTKSHQFKENGTFTIALSDIVKESKGKNGEIITEKVTSWHHISSIKIKLRETKSKKEIDLLDPVTSGKYLTHIEWVD